MSYGLRIYGPNNGRLLLDEAMRYQRIVSQTYFDLAKGAYIDISMSEADNPNLTRVAISQYEMSWNAVQMSSYGAALKYLSVTYKYSPLNPGTGNAVGFRITNTYTGSSNNIRVSGDVVCIRIG